MQQYQIPLDLFFYDQKIYEHTTSKMVFNQVLILNNDVRLEEHLSAINYEGI